jgi:signal transduction histidine kinase
MGQTFDRVLLARHFALCAGAAAAYILRSELQIGYTALSIVALSAALNFAAYLFRTHPGLAQICFVASPVIGIGGWASLIAVTGGISSPFIAGLWLEIVLSAMAMESTGIVAVTAGSLAALWIQQLFVGVSDERTLLSITLQSGFMGGMGIATFLVTRRWLRAQGNLSERHAELAGRLGSLAHELEDERVLSQMGENVARLAHGLKNAVHSLRGFVSLIEHRLEAADDRAALDGLSAAIDDLEALARSTLEAPENPASAPLQPDARGALAGIARALREVGIAHPGVEWEIESLGGDCDLPLSEEEFHEILLILLGNSAEAMKGQGRGSIATAASEHEFQIAIHDEGVGFSPDSIPKLFKRGYSTKAEGNGYGLFLARRILEQYGGALDLKPGQQRGATVELHIPIGSNHRADGASTAVN